MDKLRADRVADPYGMVKHMEKRRCVIIAGAPEAYIAGLLPSDFIIACDYGLRHALNNNIAPHLIIGDFDSYSGEIPFGISVIRTPAEKDDTDMMLAVKHAINMGFSDFLLLGATGGRIDHYLANLAAAGFIAENGGFCETRDKNARILTFGNGTLDIPKRDGCILSVFPFSGECRGVTLEGVKYPLKNAALNPFDPVGVSNEFTADCAKITVKKGVLTVILINSSIYGFTFSM
ncbi:MAG: thiamine diphosphokinase [Oscillospiraceae bacterium]|nr:thiamine diphosphokinase [Oscillospiraceae bacterium]